MSGLAPVVVVALALVAFAVSLLERYWRNEVVTVDYWRRPRRRPYHWGLDIVALYGWFLGIRMIWNDLPTLDTFAQRALATAGFAVIVLGGTEAARRVHNRRLRPSAVTDASGASKVDS